MTRHACTAIVTVLLAGCGSATPPSAASPAAEESPEVEPAALRPSARGSADKGTPLTIASPAIDAMDHAAFVRVGERWAPLRYLCDGVAGDRVVAVTAATPAALVVLAKPSLRASVRSVGLGETDAGAGSVWRDLLDPGGASVGAVRSINPGMLGDKDATTLPTLSSVRMGEDETRCRWLPRGRLLLVTKQRSAIVTAEADGSYTYRSFDHDRPGHVTEGGEAGTSSTPTVEVRNGRLVGAPAGQEAYSFAAGPWTYRVTASADARSPKAEITVAKNGRVVSTAPAVAYEMAAAIAR